MKSLVVQPVISSVLLVAPIWRCSDRRHHEGAVLRTKVHCWLRTGLGRLVARSTLNCDDARSVNQCRYVAFRVHALSLIPLSSIGHVFFAA